MRLGTRGEKLACAFLRSRDMDVLARNFRCPAGEIDIVARDGAILCFVEVKTRFAGSKSRPASGLRISQMRRIHRAGMVYLREIGRPSCPVRFDLAELVLGSFDIREFRYWEDHFSSKSLFQNST